jgi:hypothetical protein
MMGVDYVESLPREKDWQGGRERVRGMAAGPRQRRQGADAQPVCISFEVWSLAKGHQLAVDVASERPRQL